MKFCERLLLSLSPHQQFLLILFAFCFFFMLTMPLLLYIHRLLNIYSKIIREVFEWNKQFGRPITFQYSWLNGVKIGVQEKKGIVPTSLLFNQRPLAHSSIGHVGYIRTGFSCGTEDPFSHVVRRLNQRFSSQSQSNREIFF